MRPDRVRALQPVGIAEQFAAAGVYTHPSGLVEQWQVHRQPDGALRARVDLDGRAADGVTWLAELYLPAERADAMGTRLDVLRYDAEGTRLRATYTREQDVLHASWGHARGVRGHTTALPEAQWLLALRASLLFTGFALGALASRGAAAGTLVGLAADGAPDVQPVQVRFGGVHTVTVDGRPHPAHTVHVALDGHKAGTTVWLGTNSVPLGAQEADGSMVTLARFVPGTLAVTGLPQTHIPPGTAKG